MKNKENRNVTLCLYIDDMLIVISNDRIVKSIKDVLNSRFDMKDMGQVAVILGIKITRTRNSLVLDSYYMNKLLKKFNKDKSSLVQR